MRRLINWFRETLHQDPDRDQHGQTFFHPADIAALEEDDWHERFLDALFEEDREAQAEKITRRKERSLQPFRKHRRTR